MVTLFYRAAGLLRLRVPDGELSILGGGLSEDVFIEVFSSSIILIMLKIATCK